MAGARTMAYLGLDQWSLPGVGWVCDLTSLVPDWGRRPRVEARVSMIWVDGGLG